MNVNALTSAVRAQPIKALCVVALIAKIGHIAYSQLKSVSPTECFNTASNWIQRQFIVKHKVKDEDGCQVEKISRLKTLALSAFSVSALAGAGFLAASQIRG